MTPVQRIRAGEEGRLPSHPPSTNHQYMKENHVGGANINSGEDKRRLSHILNRGNSTNKLLRNLALEICDPSYEDGGGWADCGAAGTQMTALQGVSMKAGVQVELKAMAPNMSLYSSPKRPILGRNNSNCGRFVYPEEWMKCMVMVPIVLEGEIVGKFLHFLLPLRIFNL